MKTRLKGSSILYLLTLLSTPVTSLTLTTFLSLDCGGETAFTDEIGIDWVTDDNYIASGVSISLSTKPPAGKEFLATARYFPDKRSKHCYVLPAEAEMPYLVRAAIRHGASKILPLPVSFDVTINSNSWFHHSQEPDDPSVTTAVLYETILLSRRNHIDVCFNRPSKGMAWISTLELRQLSFGVYNNVINEGNKILINLVRKNTGAISDSVVRWPHDPLDRFWYSDPEFDIPRISNDSELAVRSNFPPDNNRAPAGVMADALFAPEVILQVTLPRSVREVYVASYYQVLRNVSSVNVTHPVSIRSSVGVDGTVNFTLTSGGSFQVYGEFIIFSDSIRIAVEPWNGYHGNAFLNAFEVHEIMPVVSNFTADPDVKALRTIQTSLGLASWTGDPCYPVPYDWTECDEVNRITGIYLSGENLTGTLPDEFEDLTELREIHLDNNKINGSIPSSLSKLRELVVLTLDNNHLSGDIPTSLLNQKELNFTFSGNPGLRICQLSDVACNGTVSTSKQSSTNLSLTIGVAVGVVLLALFVGAALWFIRNRRHESKKLTVKFSRRSKRASVQSGPKAKAFKVAGHMSMSDVMSATKNNEKKIGEGGYGSVYYGKLPNGREVAVKVNNVGAHQGKDEFLNEVALLTRVHHKNLVSLLGFCEEENQRVLVYEYMHHGTLSDLLYGSKAASRVVSWKTRLELALDAARGLEYLHTGCSPRIIHRDVKSTNILIDDKMVAKVADFGISKSSPDLQTTMSGPVSTMMRGTPGYLDPDFGVVLIEIIAGRQPIIVRADGSQINIISLLSDCMQMGSIASLADPALEGDYNPESMWKMAEIAWSSVQREGAERPDMGRVVRGVAQAYELELA